MAAREKANQAQNNMDCEEASDDSDGMLEPRVKRHRFLNFAERVAEVCCMPAEPQNACNWA